MRAPTTTDADTPDEFHPSGRHLTYSAGDVVIFAELLDRSDPGNTEGRLAAS